MGTVIPPVTMLVSLQAYADSSRWNARMLSQLPKQMSIHNKTGTATTLGFTCVSSVEHILSKNSLKALAMLDVIGCRALKYQYH